MRVSPIRATIGGRSFRGGRPVGKFVPNFIESVRIRGFRSLADIRIDFPPTATVLIGANGSGKSNIIHFLEMMSWMHAAHRLQEYVQRQGGADDQLFGGVTVSPLMGAEVALRTEAGRNDYRFTLAHAHPDRFIFTDEAFRFRRDGRLNEADWTHLGSGHSEARIVDAARSSESAEYNPVTARHIVNLLRRCAVYQFHDTSDSSRMKIKWDKEDADYLRSHGGNLASVLLRLQQEDGKRFVSICRYIERALPEFDRFDIKESYGKVFLAWKAKKAEKTIGAHLTSDGSLRFFALVTLLNLPPEMLPDVLFIDEPELGLHPAAVTLIGDMIKSLAHERQIVVATQSPLLVDSFDLAEIRVLEMQDGRTEIRSFDESQYRRWLEEYTSGEIWQKNLLGGYP